MDGAIPNFTCKQFDVHISDNIVLGCDKPMSSTYLVLSVQIIHLLKRTLHLYVLSLSYNIVKTISRKQESLGLSTVVQVKRPNFHTMKNKTLAEQYCL